MRWSHAFIPTLRDDPAGAEAVSHKLLVRAGYVRQLMSGVYSLLPAAFRVRSKIRTIIEEEIDRIGGQQFLLPAIHPAEVWKRSGRWEAVGEEMFRLRDRRGVDLALGMTHEEVFATLAAELTSYKQLPQLWYQIQTKFRDEPRAKSGVLRVREFTMKDSYSFDIDEAGLADQFEAHYRAYTRIFERLGLNSIPVKASSGVMGGTGSVEFMVPSDAGEDLVAHSEECGYAANIEQALSRIDVIEDDAGLPAPEKFPTPGVRTIDALAAFPGGASADRQIKTLVYSADDEYVLALLRGDHSLQEQKLAECLAVNKLRPAHEDEIVELLGATPGSLGGVGITELRILADLPLRGRRSMITGANDDGFHFRGVDVERDIRVEEWVDLREVRAGEGCPQCSGVLDVFKAIEVGHIFKLGTKYSEALGATVLGDEGKEREIWMGSYGIGLERNMAAVIESHNDERGILWPVAVAPWHVVITLVKLDEETSRVGHELYEALRAVGVDVLLDDRDERPGVKFNDAELIGIPLRITVGPRGLSDGVVEISIRENGETRHHNLGEVVEVVSSFICSASEGS